MENLRVRGMRHLATTCGVVAFREAFEPCGLPTTGERVLSNFHRWIESLGVSTLRDRRTEAERETVQRPTNVVARPNNRAKISSLEHVLPVLTRLFCSNFRDMIGYGINFSTILYLIEIFFVYYIVQ